jgi:peptidyl-prolyl cis-trans isomerase B (cyclophilin B)
MTRSLTIALCCAALLATSTFSTDANAGSRKIAKGKGKVVALVTSLGTIEITLAPKKAPKTVANFLRYVRSGHYNGTIFHRVIPNFMIQGGGMTPGMSKKPTRKPVQNEAYNGLKNGRGTVAMARTPNPHSATAQFFINVKNNSFLNFKSRSPQGWGYCVFAKVTKGMDVVDKIRKVQTTTRSGRPNVPATTVLIKKAKILR